MTQFQITHSRTWGHSLTATIRERAGPVALPPPIKQEEARELLTLQQAFDRYIARCRMKGRSETTIHGYQDVITRHGHDWLQLTLDDLGRSRRAFTERHSYVTLNSGPTAANQFMRAFRAIYRHARRFDPDLPAPPTEVIEYNPEHRREKIITDWPGWLAAVDAHRNPIVRDWYLFLAFTGMRKTSAGAVRIRHVKLDRGFLHVPNPKGGTSRAFDLPLSRHLTDTQQRLRHDQHPLAREWKSGFPCISWKQGKVTKGPTAFALPAQLQLRILGGNLRIDFFSAGVLLSN